MALGDAVGIGTRIKRDIKTAVGHLFDRQEVLSVGSGTVTVLDHRGREDEIPKMRHVSAREGDYAIILRAFGGAIAFGVESIAGESDAAALPAHTHHGAVLKSDPNTTDQTISSAGETTRNSVTLRLEGGVTYALHATFTARGFGSGMVGTTRHIVRFPAGDLSSDELPWNTNTSGEQTYITTNETAGTGNDVTISGIVQWVSGAIGYTDTTLTVLAVPVTVT